MTLKQKLANAALALRHPIKAGGLLYHNQKFAENPRWGSLSEEEDNALYALVMEYGRSGNTSPIVEVGALFGFTTNTIVSALNATESRARVVVIENFSWNPFGLSPEAHRLFFERSTAVAKQSGRFSLIDTAAERFYSTSVCQPDLVFIDANHDYKAVNADILWARLQSCSTICGHDYCSQHPGVVHAVNLNFAVSKRWNLSFVGSLWIAKRK